MHRRKLLAVAAVAALALAGCSPAADSATSTPADTFVYATPTEVVTDWDPATSYSNELIALQNIYESLTFYDPATQEVTPRLAESWESSDDGTTWTFTLRSGVTFHSGRALDATAAKEAIERTIELAGGPSYIWAPVTSIEAPDAATLVFQLEYAAPLDLIASSGYGAYIYDTQASGSDDLATWLSEGNDAGSGPYTVDEWSKGSPVELRLTAVEDYWGGWSDDAYTTIEYRVTPEATTASQLLARGDVTFAGRLTSQLVEQASEDENLSTSATPSFQNLLALLNTQSGPLADVRVRQAVQLAADLDGLVDALDGTGEAASGVIPPGLLGADDSLGLSQDLEQAEALLGEAGYGPDGEELTLTLTYAQGDHSQGLFVTLLTSALDQLNVRLDAKPMQWNAQWDQAKSEDPGARQDIFVMFWYPDYADPYSWFSNLFRSANPPFFNLAYLDDAGLDGAIDGLQALTALDPAAGAAEYEELQRQVIQTDAAVLPIYVQTYQRAFRATVEGFVDNPAYPNVVFVHDLRSAG